MMPAVFLDRDGTIAVEKQYLYKIEDWEWIEGAREAIRALGAAGYRVVITTNQAGIARGFYTEADMQRLNRFLLRELAAAGAQVARIYHCPHHPDFTGPCRCRKPLPGMLLRAGAELGLDLARSWMVGDKRTDMEAAVAAGVRPLLVRTGYGAAEAHAMPGQPVFASIREAGAYILGGVHSGQPAAVMAGALA